MTDNTIREAYVASRALQIAVDQGYLTWMQRDWCIQEAAKELDRLESTGAKLKPIGACSCLNGPCPSRSERHLCCSQCKGVQNEDKNIS